MLPFLPLQLILPQLDLPTPDPPIHTHFQVQWGAFSVVFSFSSSQNKHLLGCVDVDLFSRVFPNSSHSSKAEPASSTFASGLAPLIQLLAGPLAVREGQGAPEPLICSAPPASLTGRKRMEVSVVRLVANQTFYYLNTNWFLIQSVH